MIAIIPARSGSKGLKDKNIKDLNGKPLIAYSIEAAIKSEFVTEVVVSTDSEKYAAIAREYGAVVPSLRPLNLSGDNAIAIDVYKYVINNLEEERSCNLNEFVVLLPTAPLRTSNDIDKAIELFREKSADSVISVSEALKPISWYKKLDKNMCLNSYFPDDLALKNRQSEGMAYIPNGAIYVFNKRFIFDSGTYYSDNTYGYKMSPERSIDIDTDLEFKFAEFIMTTMPEV